MYKKLNLILSIRHGYNGMENKNIDRNVTRIAIARATVPLTPKHGSVNTPNRTRLG